MNFKTTYILFGILGAMIVVFALVLWIGPTVAPTGFILPSAHDKKKGEVAVEDVDRVTIETNRPDEEKVVFVQEGEGKARRWRMVEPIKTTVDQPAVNEMVREVLEARKDDQAEVTKDLGQWGLAPPRRVVTLEAKDRTFTLNLGEKSPGGATSAVVYVTSSDYPKNVMAVRFNQLEKASKYALVDFRSRDLLPTSESAIGYIKLQRGKEEPVVLESEGGTSWRFVKPPFGAADYEGASADAGKSPTGIRPLLDALTSIRVEEKSEPLDAKKDKTKKESPRDTGFVKNNASEKDLKEYGLRSPPEADLVLTVKKSPSDKEEHVLLIGKKADDKGEHYYARLAENSNVVKVASKNLEPIRKFLDNPAEARDRDLVRMSEGPDVVRIKYASGEPVELIKSEGKERGPHGALPAGGDTWMLYRDKEKKGLKTDPTTVNNLITALKKKRLIEDFPTGKSDTELGLKDPDVVVALWAKGVKPESKKEEKKDDKKKDDKKKEAKEDNKDGDRPALASETPDVMLEFGRVDSNKLVAVRRKTGKDLKEELVVKVPASVLELAKEDPLHYLERTVAPLLTADEEKKLTKIVVDVDSKLTELVPADPKDDKKGWVFSKPADLEKRKADSGSVNIQVLSTVNGPQVQRWVSLKPSADDLARWGLKADAPATGKITLTVKVDGKEKAVYLLLGKQTDKKEYYAKRSDLDSIFLISATEVDRFKQPLLDLKVFEFTPSDVKAVKLSGWPRGGDPYVLEIERKSGSWVAKNKPKLTVNGDRVDKLLDALRDLTAEKIVAFGTGPKAEHGLDYEKEAVEIELTLDKDKLTLMLGKEVGGSYFATSNKLNSKKDVFQIGKGKDGIFAEVKKDPDYLVKK